MAFPDDVRTYQDITIVNIATEDVLARLKSLRHRQTSEDIDIKAGKETRHHYLPGMVAESISGEAYMTTDSFIAAIGTMIGFTVDLGGSEISGSGVLSSREASWASGDAEGETFEIKVSGTPVLAA